MNLHPTQIAIAENRQRQEFDPAAMVELASSIRAVGLINPITVRNVGTASAPIWQLVAGERRLRAIRDIFALGDHITHAGMALLDLIPCTDIGTLTPAQAEEAELDENIKRKDLTWQERTNAIARLHRLRQGQAAERGETQTIAATAVELTGRGDGSYANTVSEAVLLDRHLTDPDVAKAKSAAEAVKIVQKKAKAAGLAAQAESVGRVYSSRSHSLHNADCLQWLAECPDSRFDVICTDPPYGMGAHDFGDNGGRVVQEHGYDDSPESFRQLLSAFLPHSYRVARPQAHMYLFCDIDQFGWLKLEAQLAGWYVFRTPLVNYKTAGGRVPIPRLGLRRSYELILFAVKGDREALRTANDVIPIAGGEEEQVHGAQKPVELLRDLLTRSARPGDLILDPFAGSGSIFEAATPLNLTVTGIELNPATYHIALDRLRKIQGEA
jgi:DNA modification methylase